MSKKLLGMLLSSMMLFSNLTTVQVYAEEDTNTEDENTQEVTVAEDGSAQETTESGIINAEEETGEEVTADTEQSEETEIEEEYTEEKEQQNTGDTENIVVSDEEKEELESKETITEEEIIETEEENEEKEEPSDAVVLEGQAYAVLEDDGDMIFFRSNESYTNKTTGTFTDIKGTKYTGTVYSGFENASYSSSTAVPWNSDRQSIYTVTVASEQTIKPNSTAYWFYNCYKLTSFDGTGFDTSNTTKLSSMFSYCENLTSLDIGGFDTSYVTDMGYMFHGCSKLTSLDVSGFDTSNVTNMTGMFYACNKLTSLDVSNFDTSKVWQMFLMFRGCSSLTSLDVSGFDTSKVQNMDEMFAYCRNLTSLDVSGFDTSRVTDMREMFSGCSNLTSLDLSNYDTSRVTDMGSMFSGCSNLTNLDVSNFNTSIVTSIGTMFSGCSSLMDLDVSNFDTSKVTYMAGMFSNCSSLTGLDVSNFDTSNVTDISEMFSNCVNLTTLDLSNFDTSSVTAMNDMFSGCNNLISLDLSSFYTDNVKSMRNMFYSCFSLSDVKLGKGFTKWSNQSLLPSGSWSNRVINISLTSIDLCNQYPQNAESYAGTWLKNAVIEITVLPEMVILPINETQDLDIEINPASATNKTVTWTSSDESVATVDESGRITAVGLGTTTITATTEDGGYTATCEVAVIQPVTSITLDKEEITINVNETAVLTATVEPENANNKTVIWTSNDESIAKVDENGKITAVGRGTATITATTEDGGYTATCEVTVIQPVTGMTLDKEELIVGANLTAELTATVEPENANNKTIIWTSSDENIATVDENGRITAVRLGTATITAITEDGGYTATCEVTVVQPVTGITLDKEEVTLKVNETAKLTASIMPEDAGIKTIIWSSDDESVATVDSTGKVVAVGRGTATITAVTEDGGYTATCEVTVIQPVTGITLDKEELTINVNETAEVTATVEPDNANNKTVTWTSSDESVAAVDNNGKITAVGRGTTTITATTEDGGYTATCEVTTMIKPEGIEVETDNYQLYVGDAIAINPVVLPEGAAQSGLTYTSNNTNSVKVTENGIIEASSKGNAVITIKDTFSGLSTTVTVSVSERSGRSDVITGNCNQLRNDIIAKNIVLSDGSYYFGVNFSGKNGGIKVSPTDPTKFIFSAMFSSPNLSQFEMVYDASNGTATLVIDDYSKISTTSSFDYKATLYIEDVYSFDRSKQPSFTIENHNYSIPESTIPMYATLRMQEAFYTWDDVLKELGTTILGMSEIGFGSLISPSRNRYYPAVKSFTTDKTNAVMIPGETINITMTPSPANAIPNGIVWKNNNQGLIEVHGDGEYRISVKALAAGTATISVSADGVSTKTITIQVKDPISFKNKEITLSNGKTRQLDLQLYRYTADQINWISSDPNIASVDQSGAVTAHELGTVTVVAKTKDGLYMDSCTVTVKEETEPESITLDKQELAVPIGNRQSVKATVLPADAEDKSVTWTSNNSSVATVNNKGVITAVKPGVAVITAKTNNGLTADCKVTVLFDDVTQPSQYYYDAVYWAVEKNITQGMGPTSFNPGGFCKRYQFVLFLWRQAGCPEPELTEDPFTDVISDPNKGVYEKAVLWAVDQEITTGTTPTTFDPYAPLTRGQVVTFLYRAADEPEVSTTTNPFRDLDSSKYYYIPVLWAVENKITTGLNATQFGPTNTCTRGQTVLFMYRLFGKE